MPPITAESDWDEGDNVEESESFCLGYFSALVVWKLKVHKRGDVHSHRFTFDITQVHSHSFILFSSMF